MFVLVVCIHGFFLFNYCTPNLNHPKLENKTVEMQPNLRIDIASVQLKKPLGKWPKNASQPQTDSPRLHGALQEHGKYKTTDQLDTRAAPRFEWNVEKSLVSRNIETSLIFTIWVSETGTIDALEPHLLNGSPWSYDLLAKGLQTTSMVPASVETVPVASTMTVELTIFGGD